MAAVPSGSRSRLERVIAKQTGGRINARGGNGGEFWVIGRRDLDQFLFCERLPTVVRGKPARGAWAPDVSTLLVLASGPRPDDVFLDPFGGSGSLISARMAWPSRRLIYSDVAAAEHPPQWAAHGAGGARRPGSIDVLAEDARALPSIEDGAVSVIVTDPPWGEHEQLDVPYSDFAAAMPAGLDRVLDPSRVGWCCWWPAARRASWSGPGRVSPPPSSPAWRSWSTGTRPRSSSVDAPDEPDVALGQSRLPLGATQTWGWPVLSAM